MARVRYYSEDDFEVGVTPSQLKRLGKAKQIEYMRYWFAQHYEDPANETPYNSEEGGYQYIWGGPYEASEELFDEFGRLVPEDRIRKVVDYVERDGTVDWAPGTRHSDHQRARDEWAAEHEQDEEVSPLTSVLHMLESGVVPRFGAQGELAQRQAVIARLDRLEALFATLKPVHGGMGHNQPPDDDGSPGGLIEEIRDAGKEIRGEMVKATPDAVVVARATSRLQLAMGWFLKKADSAADAFAKTLGAAAAGGVITVAGYYVTRSILPALAEAGSGLVATVTEWLQNVALPF